MYVQHPYKFEGKYYAKIDGVYYEISKEVAMAMFADYRNEIYRSRKWAPDYREEDLQMEELQDLKIVFCKPFLHKIAKDFCRLLHIHFVGNCKALADNYSASHIAIADHI